VKHDVWTKEGEIAFFSEMMSSAVEKGSLIPRLFYDTYNNNCSLIQAFPNANITPFNFYRWIVRHGLELFGLIGIYDSIKFTRMSRRGYLELFKICAIYKFPCQSISSLSPNELVSFVHSRYKDHTLSCTDLNFIEENAYETIYCSHIFYIYSIYLEREDLQEAYQKPLTRDRNAFVLWLEKFGWAEENISLSAIDSFKAYGNLSSLVRIFSFLNRTQSLYNLAEENLFSDNPHSLMTTLLALTRNGLEFDLEDVCVFYWFNQRHVEELTPFFINLMPKIKAAPSTHTVSGMLFNVGASGNHRMIQWINEHVKTLSFKDQLQSYYVEEYQENCTGLHKNGLSNEFNPVYTYYNALAKTQKLHAEAKDCAFCNGINIFGYFNSSIGLGTKSKNTYKSLCHAGIPVNKMFVGNVSLQANVSTEDFFNAYNYSYSTNLFISYPHYEYDLFDFYPEWYTQKRCNVAYLAWEQRDSCAKWGKTLQKYDQLWALSSFAARSLERVAKKHVYTVPCALDLDSFPASVGKEHFGLPTDKFVVLYIFDANSSVERKNPMAALKALASVPQILKDTLLLMKANNLLKPHNLKMYQEISDFASEHSINVKILDSYVSFDDNLRLISACDCYLSLHRAEGFGYTCAEAMAYSKPVIATNYSGNLDFMDDECALLVDYKEILNKISDGPFSRGSVWADPSPDHAGQLIQSLFFDVNLRLNLGISAKKKIANTLSIQAISKIIKDHLGILWKI
jgi:glycosyltransferase involved in cell wall biosynthesis